jgi:Cu/Ag efflux pump CusA
MYRALHRPANFIESALAGIQRDLLIGTALIALVLFAFMRNVRTVLIAFVAIPLSLITAIVVLSALGQSINTMTLGGLAVGLGVVIDDAVIGIENIVRRLRGADGDASATILDASIEVRAPVLYATFVVALTLLPVLLLTGLQGAFFAPLAASFILATLASLGVAITVTPALSYVLLRDARPAPEPPTLTRLKDAHERWLMRFCSMPRTAIAITVVVALVVPIAFASFGAELLPAFRERHYVLQVSAPPGTSVEEMRTLGTAITRDLLAIDGISTVEQQIGRAELGEDTWPVNRSEMHVELEPVTGSQETQIQARIREVLSRYKGLQTEVLTFLGDRIGESLSGETAAVAIGVYGADLDVLDRVAQQIATVLRRIPDAADVQTKSSPGTPTLRVQIDQQRLRQYGLVATDVLDTVTAAFQGLRVAQVVDNDRIVDVVVSLDTAPNFDPEQIGWLRVKGASGRNVPIDAVSDVSVDEGRAAIAHEGGRRRQVVTANPTTTDVAGFTKRVKAEIARSVALPADVYLDYAGAAAGEAAARRELLLNAAGGAFGIVALLLLAFGDGRAAALVLASAPLAFAGGIVAVFASGSVLSLGALVGFVTLFGIAARTAILLVAHADHLDAEEDMGWGLQTVLRGARERVTPILMTALVTMLALVPLAIESGEAGREVQGPMAIVILGGLLTSTLMGLFVTPALIYRFRYSAHAVARRDIQASAQ